MFKYILGLLICLSILISCKSTRELKPENISSSSHTIKETIHDTVYVVKADTSKYTASLTVDSSGNVNIKNIVNSTHGKYVTAPKVTIKNNKLEVDCYAEAQELYKQWVDKYQIDNKATVQIEYVHVKDPLTSFQSFQIWFGRILLLIIIIGLIANYLKKRINPFKL